MAFPSVATKAASGDEARSTAFNATMPSGITAGDLLVAWAFQSDNSTTVGIPSEWTTIRSTSITGGRRGYVLAKEAAGSDTLSFDRSSNSVALSVCIYRITSWYGGTISSAVEAAVPVVDYSGEGNPPSLTASWGSDDNLWIACVGADPSKNIGTFPSGYSETQWSGNGEGAYPPTGTAVKASEAAATENPGSFAAPDYFSETGVTTIAVRPAGGSTQSLLPTYRLLKGA